MDLYVLNRDLEPQAVISSFRALEWLRKAYEPGTFQVTFEYSEEMANILQIGYLLWNTDTDEPGIITKMQKEASDRGEESIIIKGYMAGRYLNQRIVNAREIISDTPQNIMRALVDSHAVDPTDPDRAIPNLYLGTDTATNDDSIDYQTEYVNLAKAISDLAAAHEIGWKIRLDPVEKKLYFDTWTGTDRTITSEQPCLFSPEFGTILSQRYYNDLGNYATFCVMAAGKDDDRITQDCGSGEGLDRYEIYANASGITTKDQTEEQIREQLKAAGAEKLAKYPMTEGFESKINFANASEFDLGDYVTCENKRWNVRKDYQIKAIRRNIRNGKDETTVTFGDEVQTLTSLIKAKES